MKKIVVQWAFLTGSFLLGACVVVVSLSRARTVTPQPASYKPVSTRANNSERGGHDDTPMTIGQAKQIISEFAAFARFHVPPKDSGYVGLGWPEVTPRVARALEFMEGKNDPEVIADLAAILLRCGTQTNREKTSGMPMAVSGYPVSRMFVSAMKTELQSTHELYEGHDAFITSNLAEWVFKNRHKLAKSAALDHEILDYKAAAAALKENPFVTHEPGEWGLEVAEAFDRETPKSAGSQAMGVRIHRVCCFSGLAWTRLLHGIPDARSGQEVSSRLGQAGRRSRQCARGQCQSGRHPAQVRSG